MSGPETLDQRDIAEPEKKRFTLPSAYTILFALIILAAAATWMVPAGAYDLTEDFTAKGYVLYRIGLCQQRLGRFEQADKTFAAVAANFPRTDAAARAKEKVGVRNFSVQVATFASPQNADTAIHALRGQGFAPALLR